ncbi:MAG: hypothetical protein KBC46_03200 [Ferrovibrio sp.]|nr:hypothetical protein [Ferrovibrio sp.]
MAIPSNSGRFGLVGPRDLLDKLQFDRARLSATNDRRAIVYAILDCAITVWSFNDWCIEWFRDKGRAAEEVTKELRERVPLLSTCELIATSAKHFIIRRKDSGDLHTSIMGIHTKDFNAGEIVRNSEYYGAIFHNGQSWDAVDLFVETELSLARYLQEHGIDQLSGAIRYEWDPDK